MSRYADMGKIGCVVCRVFYLVYSEPHMHHLSGIKYRAMGKKADDAHTIPLCPRHHQHGTKEHPSAHSHPKLFAEKYGTQEELLEMTNALLEKLNGPD